MSTVTPAWLGANSSHHGRLSTISQFRYGIVRGVPRLLQLLEDRGLEATFCVPGATAKRYPEAVLEIAHAGHEIGHHGYHHLGPYQSDAEQQRSEIERGVSVLQDLTGTVPRGYRAPFAQLTPETLAILIEHGFYVRQQLHGRCPPVL